MRAILDNQRSITRAASISLGFECYGEFASKIFEDFDPSEIEEADQTDLTIAPRLSELYRLATTGVKQKEVDKLYKKIIQDSFR